VTAAFGFLASGLVVVNAALGVVTRMLPPFSSPTPPDDAL
jgi:hypothetical protein